MLYWLLNIFLGISVDFVQLICSFEANDIDKFNILYIEPLISLSWRLGPY